MIEIKKGTEPKELLEYRQQKFASYADMPADVKKKVIKSLLLEQGHLCAYCMSRINADDGKHKTTIEHCTPQSATTEKERLIIKIWSQSAGETAMHIPMMTKAVMQKEAL